MSFEQNVTHQGSFIFKILPRRICIFTVVIKLCLIQLNGIHRLLFRPIVSGRWCFYCASTFRFCSRSSPKACNFNINYNLNTWIIKYDTEIDEIHENNGIFRARENHIRKVEEQNTCEKKEWKVFQIKIHKLQTLVMKM